MGWREHTEQTYGVFSEGEDNTTPPDSPEIRGTLSLAANADLVDSATLRKRNGYTVVTTLAGKYIRGGLEYKTVSSGREQLVFSENSVLTGTSGVLSKFVGTGAPTTILTGLLDGVKPSIIQYRSLAFLFNGKDNKLYDGSGTRNIGITPPTNAPTLSTLYTGSLNASGSYLACYTYYNSKTGAESSPSPVSAAVVTGTTSAHRGINWFVTPGDPTYCDKIRLYRTRAGTQIFFHEKDVDSNVVAVTSDISDAGLGFQLEVDNGQLTSPAKFGVVNDNRVFCGGFSTNPNRVQYSKIGINGAMPESFQAADFVDCNINDGDKLLGLGKANTMIIALKERAVGKLIRVSASAGGLEVSGSQKYIYEEISSEVTGVSYACMISLDSLTFWLGKDDIYATDGSAIFRFGKRIRNTIKSLNFNQSHKWSVINKVDTKQIIWSVTTANKNEPDYQIVLHYRDFPRCPCTHYTAGSNTTTHPGLVAGSFWLNTETSQNIVYFGGVDGTGNIYKLDSGTSDNSLGIYFDCRLPWDGGAEPNHKKMFSGYFVGTVGGGLPPNNILTHTFEVDIQESITETATSSLGTVPSTWGSPTKWVGFTWASTSFAMAKFFPHVLAYYGRYGFNNTYADQPITVRATTKLWKHLPIH